MYRLLQLLHSYRAFLLLLFLEIICIWLLVRNNPYHSAAYFHTSNSIIGNIFETRENITQYFNLPSVNQELSNDNALLREMLAKSQVPIVVISDQDSLALTKNEKNHKYLSAKVINNSIQLSHNYLTINKGSNSGVESGMGVISANGIVGKVMSVSKNYATVASLLNKDVFVSSFLPRSNTFCSINWHGSSNLSTKLKFVPRHIALQQGDTVVTSGYSTIFPENMMIGFIENFEIGENDSWYDIDVKLSNDFSSLAYVYVVKNPNKEERIELESENMIANE